MSSEKTIRKLWSPPSDFINNSNLKKFEKWLEENKNLSFDDYDALWSWSVENIEDFWQCIWEYFEILSSQSYSAVLKNGEMPGAEWFSGTKLNYAEHIFEKAQTNRPAIIFQSEHKPYVEISWAEMEEQVASIRAFLIAAGVRKGDRVVAFLPNIPQATYAFLAACSLGAIWSSCSPDFGANSVIDRFAQIEPKILFAVDGYSYNGKPYDKMEVLKTIYEALPTVEQVVFIPYLNANADHTSIPNAVLWTDTFQPNQQIAFERVAFEHPIWVLYSSGTTGKPKAITHAHGGVLLEHLKYLHFHNDVKPGERFFWFSTTGWMMWNFVHASFLAGATIVLYDGSPGYPDLNVLWAFTQRAKIHHFGTSAPYLIANMKRKMQPGKKFDLSHLRSIGSTGSPLPPESFDWVYKHIKSDVWLCSMAGGTDVCTAWVGGCPVLPVYEGEIQCRCLGAPLYAFDENGKPVVGQVGEMVITKPMPSMPVFFWNDTDGKRYKESYFEMFPGVWRHGDWVKITNRGSVVILGRSDATLNRQGVRIGTAEIYRAVNKIEAVKDSLIINLEMSDGKDFMPLFVVMQNDRQLTEALQLEIKKMLRTEYSPRHVPDEIIAVSDIPYTISGKKMEAPVKKLLKGVPVEKAATADSMKNPESLTFFINFQKRLSKRFGGKL